MRLIDADMVTLLKSQQLVYHMRCEIQDAGGAWVDYTNAFGVNWLRAIRWSGNVDRPVMYGTITLLRETAGGALSIAPSMTGSPANSGGPAIIEGRLMRLSVAVVPPGTFPISTDWREVVPGVVDAISYGSKAPTMDIEFRDIGSRLLDTSINAERDYGSDAGVDMADVGDQIISDNWSVPTFGAAPTTYVPDPVLSAFAVSPTYRQRQEKVLEALTNLAMQNGQVWRYKYDDFDNFRLTLFDPLRDRTTTDYTFEKNQYIELPRLARSRDDVSNQVRVNFISAVGTQETYFVEDAASRLAFGPKYIQFGLDVASQVRTFLQAAKLADSALWDLSEPVSEHVTEGFCFWPAEPGDRYIFRANGRQYDTDQTFAVMGFDHVYTAPGKARTTLTTRGKVAGMGRQWRERGQIGFIPIDKVRPSISARVTPGTATIGASVNVYAIPRTTYQEKLGVRAKFLSDDDAIPFYLCVNPGDPTPRYVDSGFELGPTDWFYWTDGTSAVYRQLFANIPLLDLSIQTLYLQSYGFFSSVSSDWVAVVLDTRLRPELASASISASNPVKIGSDYAIKLTVTFTGGRGIKSVSDIRVYDVDADPADAIVDSVNIDPGQTVTRTYLILASAAEVLDKTWGATLTPNSNVLASAGTGILGFPIVVTTSGDAYQNASVDDMQAADDDLQSQIDAIIIPTILTPSIQLAFGNGTTPPTATDWVRAAPAAPWRVLGWHVDAVDATGAKVAISAAFTIKRLPWAGGAPVTMATGASGPRLVSQSTNQGTTSGWTDTDGATGDSAMAILDSVTIGTATSVLVTLTLQPL